MALGPEMASNAPPDSEPRAGSGRRRFVLWLMAVLLACVAFAWAVFHREEPEIVASGVTYFQAVRHDPYGLLPTGASDVHYALRQGDYYANFRMDEKDFLEWTRSRGWAVSPIPDGGVHRPAVWAGKIILREVPAGHIYESRVSGNAEGGPMLRILYDRSVGRVYLSRVGE